MQREPVLNMRTERNASPDEAEGVGFRGDRDSMRTGNGGAALSRWSAFTRPALIAVTVTIALSAWWIPSTAHASCGSGWGVDRSNCFDAAAARRLKTILARSPYDAGALNRLVAMHRKSNSPGIKNLVRSYEKLADKKPKNFAYRVILARLYLKQSKRPQAIAAYEHAISIDPKAARVHAKLGEMYKRDGRKTDAIKAFERVITYTKKKNLKKQTLRTLASIALNAKDITRAKNYLEQFLVLDPRNTQVRIELGDALRMFNKHEQALAIFQKVEKSLSSQPARRVEVIARIGQIHEDTAKDAEAIKEYRRAIKMVKRGYYIRKELTGRIIGIYRKPRWKKPMSELIAYYEKAWPSRKRGHFEWDTLAQLYAEDGNQDKAVVAYRAATKKSRYELDTHRRFIKLLEDSGRDVEAIKQYEVVTKIAPGEARFQLQLARRYWAHDDRKKALALLKRMESRFPRDGGVYSAIAELYTQWGQEDRALAAYVRLSRIEPNDVNHLTNLGEQYWLRGKKSKALAIWKRIVTRKTAANYARLGEIYSDHHLLTQALAVYNKSIQLDTKNPDRYKGRATVFDQQRRYADAIQDWYTVLKLTPKSGANKPARKEARRRIVSLLTRAGNRHLSTKMQAWRRAFDGKRDLDAAWFLVESYRRLRRYKDARVILEKLYATSSKDTTVMQELARAYDLEAQRDGQRTLYNKAIDIYRKLAETQKGREAEFYRKAADVCANMANEAGNKCSIEYSDLAIRKSPKDPKGWVKLAQQYLVTDFSEEGIPKAIDALKQAIKLDKRRYQVYLKLAGLYAGVTRDADNAVRYYLEVVKRASEPDMIRKAADSARAVEYESQEFSLADIEKEVARLAFTYSHKPIYRHVLVDIYGVYIEDLVEKERAGGAWARAELTRIGKLGMSALLEALRADDRPKQQRIAVQNLGYLRNPAAAPALVAFAMKERKAAALPARFGSSAKVTGIDLRVEALVSAARLGSAAVAPKLIQLASHSEKTLREAAVFGLGMIGENQRRQSHRKVSQTLVAKLKDSLPSVQTLACLGLARFASPATPLLQVVSDSERAHHTRAACAYALGVRKTKTAIPTLVAALDSGNDDTQRLAAWALGAIGASRATPHLLRAYFHRHPRVRKVIAWSLGALATPRRQTGQRPPTLQSLAYDRPGAISFDAVAAVDKIIRGTTVRSVPIRTITGHTSEIIAGIKDGLQRHTDVQLRVLLDLNSLPTSLGLGTLTAASAQATPPQRAALRKSMDKIGSELLPRLVKLAEHRDAKVRTETIKAISRVNDPRVGKILQTAMLDQASIVRTAALRSSARHFRLHALAGAQLAAAVQKTLESRWEREEAVRALGDFGPHAPTERLLALAKDADEQEQVRRAAIGALGRLGEPRALPTLRELRKDPRLADAARSAIENINKK